MGTPKDNSVFEKIDRYLQDQMTWEEQVAFEQEVENDPDLKQEVEIARAFLVGMENLGTEELRKELKATNEVLNDIRQTTEVDFGPDKTSAETGRRSIAKTLFTNPAVKKVAGIAALLVIVFGAAYCLFFFFQKSDTQSLFAQYYEKPPNLLTMEVRSEAPEKPEFRDLMKAYEKGQHQKAIEQANAYLETHSNNYDVRFYRGILHLEQEHFQQALDDLQATKAENPEYHGKVLWYLALTHLAMGEETEAQNRLKALQEGPPSAYQQKAEQLMRQLN